MCGRYESDAQEFADRNALRVPRPVPRRWNVAPTQAVAAVLSRAPDVLDVVRWGLIPSWAKDRKIAASLINARSETAAEKPSFRSAFKRRPCLIPANGFYEWKKVGTGKVPHRLALRSGQAFAFAGLWEEWRDPEAEPGADPLLSCTILTCAPNELAATIHDRMPVILRPDQHATWLRPDLPPEERQAMLAPFPAEEMLAHPVDARVGNVRNDGPDLAVPV